MAFFLRSLHVSFVSFLFSFLMFPGICYSTCQSHARIIFVRHGHGEHIQENRRNSRPDTLPPAHLTPLGILEIENTAHELQLQGVHLADVAAFYSSPLPRTRQTAAVLFETMRKHSTSSQSLPTSLSSITSCGHPRTELEQIKNTKDDIKRLDHLVADTASIVQLDDHIIEKNQGNCEGLPFTPRPECDAATMETNESILNRSKEFLQDIQTKVCDDRTFDGKVILVATHNVVVNGLYTEINKVTKSHKTGEFAIFDLPISHPSTKTTTAVCTVTHTLHVPIPLTPHKTVSLCK